MAESATMKGLNNYGFDPESEEWIEGQLAQLESDLQTYRKKRNHKWIHITECKIAFYRDKRVKKNGKPKPMKPYGRWTEEMIIYLKDNVRMSEQQLSFEIGISRTAIHNKKIKLGI